MQKEKLITLVLLVALVVAGGSAAYFYSELAQLKKNPQQLAQREAQALVAQVSTLIVLPEGETPTIATVNDLEKLKDQAFFNKAQKGDKVLIWANAKKAVLYRPSTNKIVEVAPLNISSSQEKAQQVGPQKGK